MNNNIIKVIVSLLMSNLVSCAASGGVNVYPYRSYTEYQNAIYIHALRNDRVRDAEWLLSNGASLESIRRKGGAECSKLRA